MPVHNSIKRTLCASCEEMWDGFGLPCPRKNCSTNTQKCEWYKRMSDDDLLHFAPEFWNETFVHHYMEDDECEKLHTDEWIMWQPVRPLLKEIQNQQLTLF